MSPILITGGAGYIGSHVVLALHDAGCAVVVLDDLSTERRDLVPDDVPFVQGDVSDGAKLITEWAFQDAIRVHSLRVASHLVKIAAQLAITSLLVADAARIRKVLDWTPRHDHLGKIVSSAIVWKRKLLAEAAT